MDKLMLSRLSTLCRRELLEHRFMLLLTPLIMAVVVTVVMAFSALLANQLTVVGDALFDTLATTGSSGSMNISIDIEENGGQRSYSYKIEDQTEPVVEEDWNFSREWSFEPPAAQDAQTDAERGQRYAPLGQLNPALNILHGLFLLVLFSVSAYYLLGSLYNDRKDRSILFWKSMPVSEWEEVLVRLGIVLLVVPAAYLAASLLTQLASVVIAMLMFQRMEMDPVVTVLNNINFVSLIWGQLSGWLHTALWIAPCYAWLLLASAGAKKTPLLLAVAPILTLILIEQLFIGTQNVSSLVTAHMPHDSEGVGTAVGFYANGPDWSLRDVVDIVIGLLITAAAIYGAVWLRRNRFEIA
jgi:ABC-2 type transport system permease protein